MHDISGIDSNSFSPHLLKKIIAEVKQTPVTM